MPLPLRFANVRSWPIADVRPGLGAATMLTSAFDPKRTFLATPSDIQTRRSTCQVVRRSDDHTCSRP